MLEGTRIPPVDVDTLYTNDLIREINAFDREAIVRQAKSM